MQTLLKNWNTISCSPLSSTNFQLALSVSSVFLPETPGGFRDSLSCTPASGVIILNWMNTTDFVHIIKGYIPNRGSYSFTIFYNFSASLLYSFTTSCRLSDGTVRKKPQNLCLFMLVGPADQHPKDLNQELGLTSHQNIMERFITLMHIRAATFIWNSK